MLVWAHLDTKKPWPAEVMNREAWYRDPTPDFAKVQLLDIRYPAETTNRMVKLFNRSAVGDRGGDDRTERIRPSSRTPFRRSQTPAPGDQWGPHAPRNRRSACNTEHLAMLSNGPVEYHFLTESRTMAVENPCFDWMFYYLPSTPLQRKQRIG